MLLRRAPRIVRVGSVGHLVVATDHLDGLARLPIEQRQIHGHATVVPRTLRGVGDENAVVGRRRFPEDLRHEPGPIAVVNQMARLMFYLPTSTARSFAESIRRRRADGDIILAPNFGHANGGVATWSLRVRVL